MFQKRPQLQETQRNVLSERTDVYQQPRQITIEKSKFSSLPRSIAEEKSIIKDLPSSYGEDSIKLAIRDPWWIYCYWGVTTQTESKLRESIGEQYHKANWVLRVYDVSFIIFNGNNAHRYFDISINPQANSWYINVSSGRSFCVDLCLKLDDGSFAMVLRSNTVMTPLDGPSWIMDEEWLIPDEEFMKLYSFGMNATSLRMKRREIDEHISSSGFRPLESKSRTGFISALNIKNRICI